MDFVVFLLVNATLFIRPMEIVPSLEGLPIYNVLILIDLALCLGPIWRQLRGCSLRGNPISLCVVGLLAAVILSHLSHAKLALAVEAAVEFGKVVLYYLLLVAVLRSPGRLRLFLLFLVAFTIILSGLALLQYHGAIDIPSLAAVRDMEVDPETGEEIAVMRICSTGIYNDPNDLCLILLVAMAICLYALGDRRFKVLRPLWLAPLGLFLYTFTLTHSRGGFLALVAAMMVLFHARFGGRKAAILATLALPAMFVLFAGRQTSISMSEDTGQDRIQLWAEGFAELSRAPLFGIGYGRYPDAVGMVAHNSYIHCFTELGYFGGTLFLGTFGYALWTIHRLGTYNDAIMDPDMRRLRPYLLALIVAYAAGILTISRNYIVPTYMVLGLETAYIRLVAADSPELIPRPIGRLDGRLASWFAAAGLGFLVAANIFVKLFVRWG